jgi:osomolarity two-component system response regulator SSK1
MLTIQMDIQLPVMSGIEATKEIRRLERVNHIGVFTENNATPSPVDSLGDLPFPSPVIIVALTASSRESDRNEALAAGCNDFLTKPVSAPWMERKAIEWGCMQALIWTSFDRKRRRMDCMRNGVVNNAAVDENAEDNVEETTNTIDKPVVTRNESGDSVLTQGSVDVEDGEANV